ncbi:MAG: LOG family protein [Candidatus Nomurabacteria bacterium]|nr:LOG family protein [Candidatus Nomurabacteria bacterium]
MTTEIKYEPRHITTDDIKNGCMTLTGNNGEETKLCMIQEEFRQGIDSMTNIGPSVTFYGSARLNSDHPEYIRAYNLSYRIAKELNYIVMSGGGGGIMEAANKGAFDAGVESIGLTIRLPKEQFTNPYVTKEIPFHFFFARQVSMQYTTEACIYCAGGTGTMYEFFEMLTHLQTGKIGPIPIILFGTEFWTPIKNLIQEQFVEKYKTISQFDIDRCVITDDMDQVLDIVKKSKIRTGEDELN